MKVQVLYDFSGEPGSDELSITQGEILSVTRQDVGEGWWEGVNSSGKTGLFPASYVVNYDTADFWGDEEWDDEVSTSSNAESAFTNPPNVRPPPITTVSTTRTGSSQVVPPIRTKYTNFAKTGGESFILGSTPVFVPEDEKVYILEIDSFVSWNNDFDQYTVSVASPKKESKLKGLKSFIAYQLTPSFNNIQVSRRYKHFDWLHERLEEKYCLIPIPPLPEKQISNRYDENFIDHRKHQLQEFVDYVCRHPVLSRCPVWLHFITCTDEKMWKNGKRKAEKDELVGANFFHSIQVPEVSLNQFVIEQDTGNCQKFVHAMESAVKNFMDVSVDLTKKYHGIWKLTYQKVGHSFYSFGQAMCSDVPQVVNTVQLTEALKKTGDTYNSIGKMYEDQPKLDWERLSDMLHIYKGVLSSMPDILNIHRRALQTKRECEKQTFDQKMTTEKLEEVNKRTDVVSYAILAEINNFHKERAQEVSKSIRSFLKVQIDFHQMIADSLQQAYNSFEC